MRYLPLLLITSCYFGSTSPEGELPTPAEDTAISCVIRFTNPSPRTTSLVFGLGILASPPQVAEYCLPEAASCALLLEGLIVYDGTHTGDVVHEVLHHFDWLENRRIDYEHSDKKLWRKSGGESSIEVQCKAEVVDAN